MSAFKDMDLLEGAEEELAAAGSPQERNWRGVAIALIVIFVMCSIIAIAVLLLTPLSSAGDERNRRVSLDDVVGLSFLSPIESMEWLDSHRLVVKHPDTLELLDLADGVTNSTRLLDAEALYRYGKAGSACVAPDENYVLVSYSAAKKSLKNVFRIYDRRTSTFESVGPTRNGDENVRVLVWNPVGEDFAYVYNGSIYYQESPSSNKYLRVTKDEVAEVVHGVTDWLYEEEIFQSQQALWWAKSGEYLAYLTIDNRLVSRADIPIYAHRYYPLTIQQHYPKTGAVNLPLASLSIWRKSDGSTKQLRVTGVDSSLITYLYSASWIRLFGTDVLLAVWSNRYQNVTVFSLCTFDSGVCVMNFVQKYSFDNFRLWAEPDDAKVRFHSENAYFALLPHRRSNGNVYTQIARINVKKNLKDGRETFLEMGEYDVERIEHFDAEKNLIYFTAAAPDPTQRHLFVTSASTTGSTTRNSTAKCVTCGFSSNCTFHTTSFAVPTKFAHHQNAVPIAGAKEQYLFLSCKGPGTPHVVFAHLKNSTNFVKMVEYGRNKALERALSTHFLPNVKFDNFTLSDGTVIYTKILLPYDIPTKPPYSVVKRYPVLVDVYAGPGTQKVTQEWLSTSSDVFFSSSEEYVVVIIDGRGSGRRGWQQKQPLYGNFGTVEVDDQIFAVKEILKRYPFLDRHRVGIWGWSYGGFVSARAIQRDRNSTFKCAASVAPVTNFKYYDATYTERYMGDAPPEAYALTDLTRNVSAFHHAQFLLAHGTADDNVHYQNTAEFVRSLTEDNVQFQMMAYTDDAHNLASARPHLYNMLRNFFRDCFA